MAPVTDPATEPSRTGPFSTWYETRAPASGGFPPLDDDIRADATVVGGGFTGLSAALHLAERGTSVVLLEARRIASGASGRNGGQLQSGYQRDMAEIEGLVGREKARALWSISEEAKDLVLNRIDRHRIACEFRPGVVQLAARQAHADLLRRHAEHLSQTYGYERVRLLTRSQAAEAVGTDIYFGGLADEGAGHLNPLALAFGLARAAAAAGARLFEDTPVLSLASGPPARLKTPRGMVTAENVLFACGASCETVDPETAARVLPLHNFIVATAPLGRRLIPSGAAAYDTRFAVRYWRETPDGRLLFGGGEATGPHPPEDVAGLVRPHLANVYPALADVPIDHAWGGTLGLTLSRLPYLRRRANVFVVTGFAGHGLALAPMAGKIAAEAILGDRERFDLMASLPAPRFPGGQWLRRPLFSLALGLYRLQDRV